MPGGFLFGYGLQRGVIGKLSHGRDEIILLVTLGLAIILDNAALFAFSADERLVQVPYDLDGIDTPGQADVTLTGDAPIRLDVDFGYNCE